MDLQELIRSNCSKEISDCSNEELYRALLLSVKSISKQSKSIIGKRKLYYISAEFLIGKLLINNLINLGIYDEVKSILSKNGKNISEIEEYEPEPSLGNGGLGRLAACFLDSIATLSLNGDGIGINYHFGLFKQVFKDNMQTELPDNWIENPSWLTETERLYPISFNGITLNAKMYDIDINGYDGATNKLHLFDIETPDSSIINNGINFDKRDIKKNLSLFLYPDDSDEDGKLLRLYQQYFLVSGSAQLIIDECIERGGCLENLDEYVVIQINDTHPAMIIPELIRQLNFRGIAINKAIEIVSKTVAYTNHTILAEALEKWPILYIEKVAPEIIPIIEILDNRIRRKNNDGKLYIIDENETVHMARLAIHYSFSVNGVASLHTEILKTSELAVFNKIYPDKFNNKTNGITFRRWLLKANPKLTEFVSALIGTDFKKNANELSKLGKFTNDEGILTDLTEIKAYNKERLSNYLAKEQSLSIDPSFIFDIQIKRLHEYKRQQMNALYIINKYLEIKNGILPPHPIAVIFGAKAAPAYQTAKDIIHLILCLKTLIEADETVNKYLNVIMVENYNVTKAEKLIPACEISEQISLASKEASGTGNMKFMLNGAVTLGTEDGANVEIHKLVGDDNIYIFGKKSDEIIEKYNLGNYNPKLLYENDTRIKSAVDYIISDAMKKVGNSVILERLKNELVNKDWYMSLLDFEAYRETKDRAIKDYCNKLSWSKKMLINISKSGYFSSDRTIMEYNKDIWRLNKEIIYERENNKI